MSASLISDCQATAYTIPTDRLESDGTLQWDNTTLLVVQLFAGNACGVGYTYCSPAALSVINHHLKSLVIGADPFDIPRIYEQMIRAVRNLGRPGIVSMAISAIDTALWDMKAKLMNLPLVDLLGRARSAAPIYGSGGFTSYSDAELAHQAERWVSEGIMQVKIKVGREPDRDRHRVQVVRDVIGDAQLMVDANGGYDRKQAIQHMQKFAELGVTWFEEPVSSDDLEGLRLIRDANFPGMEIAAGEYGFDPVYFRRMLQAGAVDVLQADATRCGGITGFAAAAAIAESFQIPLSTHCAPTIHAHLGCTTTNVRHLEFFHDHVRIERMFFDGFLSHEHGVMCPSEQRLGLGIVFKQRDAEPYQIAS